MSNTESADLLITNGLVVTVDRHNRVLEDGAIAVRGDRIVAIGPSEDLIDRYVADRVIDARRKLVMPGLIDTYHHAGHGMIKGLYRSQVGWPANQVYFHGTTPEWWHADGLLTAVERMKFGVTTGVSIIGATPARTDDSIFAKRNADAVIKVGTRAVVGVGPPDPFGRHLTRPWSGTFFDDGKAIERTFTYERTIDVARDVIAELKGLANGRVQTMFAIPYLCGDPGREITGPRYYPYTEEEIDKIAVLRDKAMEARRIAEEFDVLIHTLGARGIFEWAEGHYGPRALREILGPDVIFGHANGLTERDIEIMAETGCAAAAVPFGLWNTSLGPCPIARLLKDRIRVAIATDGAAPFHVSDLFIHLHRAMFLQWMHNRDLLLLPAGRAVRLVTAEAAEVLGLGAEVGSLEVGKKADVILIDLEQPHLVPCEDPVNMIVYYVRGNDVDTVIVDGVILMEGRQVMTVDEGEVLEYARQEIERAFDRVDVSRYTEYGHGFWRGWRETPVDLSERLL